MEITVSISGGIGFVSIPRCEVVKESLRKAGVTVLGSNKYLNINQNEYY